MQIWDLVIVGAGIAGSALAHSQAKVSIEYFKESVSVQSQACGISEKLVLWQTMHVCECQSKIAKLSLTRCK